MSVPMMGTTMSRPERIPSVTGISMTKRTMVILELVNGLESVLLENLTHHLLEFLLLQLRED